jgi:hypothetical protein
LQRLCVAGRCPDKAETSATLVGQAVPGLATDQSRGIFREAAQGEINVIAGMAP